MVKKIFELFGYSPNDVSVVAAKARKEQTCPSIGGPCSKEIGSASNRIRSGVCAITDKDGAPVAVYNKIMDRLGSELADYPLKNNSLTFIPIQLCDPVGDGVARALKALKPKTTTIQQVQIAFSSPTNLPDAGSYEKAIRAALGEG